MARFAAGKNAFGISDRSGFRYRLKDMRKEWNGSLVGPDEYEAKHPQLEPIRTIPDAEAIRNPRPDVSDDNIPFIVFTSTGKDIIPSSIEDLNTLTGSVGTVTITSDVPSTAASTFDSTNVTLDSATKTFDEG
tara:strand:- start:315 stop:713 length:399 start_codon:yes stop_codon:yes gene_type:complete